MKRTVLLCSLLLLSGCGASVVPDLRLSGGSGAVAGQQSGVGTDAITEAELAEKAETDPAAAYDLARLLYDDKRDLTRARALLESAAKAGDARAQYTLYQFLRLGTGTPVNEELALFWLREAVKQNHSMALYHLGVHTYRGSLGVTTDLPGAKRLLRESALLGIPVAAASMATIECDNPGEIEDKTECYAWALVAKRLNAVSATERLTRVQPLLTEQQLTDATEEANDILASIKKNVSPAPPAPEEQMLKVDL